MPEDLDMELIIKPLNTELRTSILEELGRLVIEEFKMKYSTVKVVYPGDLPSADSQLIIEEYRADTLMLTEHFNRSGVFPTLFKIYGIQHVLAVTDMYLANVDGSLNEGAMNKARDKAAISCSKFKHDDFEKILGRLLGLALHEVGHLYGLKHHIHEMGNERYCPMLPGGHLINHLGFDPKDPKKFDYLDDKLCLDCRDHLIS
ncbi:hypothetical protein ACFL1H_00835 [Nanoarchaeota archaeon]